MSNKVYDILKWITLVFLPALTTLTGVILNCFNVVMHIINLVKSKKVLN